MLPLTLPTELARAALDAIAWVSGASDDPRVGSLVAFVAEELGASATPAGPGEAALATLAAQVTDAAAREGLVQRMVLAAMLVPPLDAARLDRLEAAARALGRGDEPALLDLRRALAGHARRLTMGLMRRFPPNRRITAAWRRGGAGVRWRIVKGFLRLGDARTAARYRALATLPEGTLGRAYFEHCRVNGFAMPGERGALPEPVVFHDMGHALLGEPTDVAGETRMAGFEAGAMRELGFVMLEFTLLLFNLGAPLPTDAAPRVGAVAVDVLLAAVRRGRASGFDVLGWDPWQEVAVPVAELRRRHAIVDAAADPSKSG